MGVTTQRHRDFPSGVPGECQAALHGERASTTPDGTDGEGYHRCHHIPQEGRSLKGRSGEFIIRDAMLLFISRNVVRYFSISQFQESCGNTLPV